MKKMETMLPLADQIREYAKTAAANTTTSSEISPEKRVSDEEWTEIKRRQQEEERQKRIERAGIPKRYVRADIRNCTSEIQQYAKDLRQNLKRGIVIRGDVGRGKTYAATAILTSVINVYRVRFTTMGDILREIKATYNDEGTEQEVVGKYTNCDVLVIDDIGKERPTPWVLETVYAIVDSRYRQGKITIYTTQYTSKGLIERFASSGDIETAKSIVSRIQDNDAVVLKGKDRRIAS